MNFKLNALMAAALALGAATGAHAGLTLGEAPSLGNSSAAFVAMDNNGTISLTVDLGVSFADFLAAPGITQGAGNLSAAGTVAQWNLLSNSLTVNGAAVGAGTYNWTSQVTNFFNNAAVTGGNYRWGIVASDGVVSPTGPSAGNLVQGNNFLMTTAVPDFDNSFDSGTTPASVGTGAGNINNLFAGANNQTSNSTHNTSPNGASTATGGDGFVGSVVALNGIANLGVQVGTNEFLVAPTTVASFLWANQGLVGAGSRIFQIGATYGLGQESTSPATWTWDSTTSTLTYAIPAVPEPGSYALLLAGLAAVSLVARRRSAR